MMALGSDPRAVALRVHLLFVFAGAVALGVGSVVLLIAAGVWLGAGGGGGPLLFPPAPVVFFFWGGVPFVGFLGGPPRSKKEGKRPPGPNKVFPGGFGLAGLTAIGSLWIAAGLYRPLRTSRDFTESLPEASRPEGL